MHYPKEIICFFFVLYLQKKSLIRFNHDNFLMFPELELGQWIAAIAKEEGYTIEEVEYNFVDADKMLSLNREYLNHDITTDIITFDYTETKALKAEVYISFQALRKNAESYTQTIENECLRLLSHAILHCLGYNDKSNVQKQHMRSKEDDCINLFHVKH
tara:strand:+ start:385 stop:861 length:477 start_codon:yes stop_codon:yes gene_type:complete